MIRTIPIFSQYLLYLATALVLPASIASAQVVRPQGSPNQPPVPAVMKLRLEGDRVTAEIRATPLHTVLEELAARTGIIFEVGGQVNTQIYMTLYKVSLQEAIQRLLIANDSIFYYEQDPLGHSRIKYVRVFPRVKGGEAKLRYIGTGVPTKTSEDLVETPEQALKALVESKNIETRQKAIEVLAVAKGGEVAVQALTKALEDPAVEVKVAAIEALASLGARSSLPNIVLTLKDSHPGVRQSAVEAVALLGDLRNLKDLRSLAQDKDEGVARAAEVSIRKLSEQRP